MDYSFGIERIRKFTLFCHLEVSFDCYDVVRSWEFHLDVYVARVCQELGERRPAKDDMIGAIEGDHLETNVFGSIVILFFECHFEDDLS